MGKWMPDKSSSPPSEQKVSWKIGGKEGLYERKKYKKKNGDKR